VKFPSLLLIEKYLLSTVRRTASEKNRGKPVPNNVGDEGAQGIANRLLRAAEKQTTPEKFSHAGY